MAMINTPDGKRMTAFKRTNRRHRGIMETRSIKLFSMAVLVGLALAMLPAPSQATFLLWEDGVNHHEIDWKYTETEHFKIYWYPEVKYTARQLVKIAEEIYDHDSKMFNFELKDKQVVVILDTEDYANGFAAHSFNWITIWATHLYGETRGRVDWLADVFSHELGHIISLKSASVFRENMYGILVGGARTSRKYNFDLGAGFMYGTETLPTWMVEGVAQFSSMTYGADPYDTHREMLLRMATLEDHLLTMDQMDIIYDKNSLQAEMVYNQGFAMNAWIGESWGLDAPARMWHESGIGLYPTYNRMLKKELGLSREQLYNQWKAYLIDKYNKQTEGVRGAEAKGLKLKLFHLDPPDDQMNDNDKWLEGISNYHVQYSPDGEWIALASSHGTQRRGTKIYIKKVNPDPEQINDAKIRKVDGLSGGSTFSWSPDSKSIVYSKHGEANLGYYYQDLWVYDVAADAQEQITHELRAGQPSWSPDEEESKIAFVINKDGQQKLAVMNYPRKSGHYMLVDFDDATQIGMPKWSPDGSKLVVLIYRHKKQDIWTVNSDGTDLRPVTYDNYDNRDPGWMPDGEHVVFSSDRTGIFNLYKVNLANHEMTQLTNVLGGACYPSVKADGSSITYSYFTSWGYRAYEIYQAQWMNKKVEDFEYNVTDAEIQRNLTTSDWIPEIDFRDYSVFDGIWGLFPVLKDHAGTWVWIPIVLYDDQRLEIGSQTIMVDAVERNLVFTYVTVGEDQRYSFFYENYMLPVTAWMSMHRIFPSIADDFQFFNFDVSARFDASFYFLGLRYVLWGYTTSFYYAYQDIRVDQPSRRYRQMTGRALNLDLEKDGIPKWPVDASINPRGGNSLELKFAYATPDISEPFTGAKMGTDLAGFWSDPAQFTLAESLHYPDEYYLLPDYGYAQFYFNYKNYLEMPWWDLSDMNDVEWLQWMKFDWEKLNFERWKRMRHTLVLKAQAGFTHSTVPEGYGWGNSYGRVNSYDRFHGGGMYVSGLGAYSDNSAFLGYENYSLEGETMAIAGFDYRFPVWRDIDAGFWAFYFDSLYCAFFGNVGNYWAHVNEKEHLFDANYIFDKNADGKFEFQDDLLSDIGFEVRLTSYLFASGWDSFVKVAHGFRDNEKDERPVRFYIGLGTGFDD
jgi:WD40 repeat protein